MLSCEKEKLEGETSMLIGKWNWTASILVPNHCDVDSTWDYVLEDEASNDNTYSLEFLEKGKLIFRHNGATIWNKRIVFDSKEEINEDPYSHKFEIRLNNETNDPMIIWVGDRALLVHDYPKDTDTDCEEMYNYFEKI